MRTIHNIFAGTQQRMMTAARGSAADSFCRMSTTERDEFNAWLITNNVLPFESGSQDQRFVRFMIDHFIGIYKGPLP